MEALGIRGQVEVAQWQVEAIKEGIAAADAGALIPHEQVKEWVLGSASQVQSDDSDGVEPKRTTLPQGRVT